MKSIERTPEEIAAELARWDGIERRRDLKTSQQIILCGTSRRQQAQDSAAFQAYPMQPDCEGNVWRGLACAVAAELVIFGVLYLFFWLVLGIATYGRGH